MPPQSWQRLLQMSENDTLGLLLNSYMTQSGDQARQTLEAILAQPNAILRIYVRIFGSEKRAALKALADIARRKSGSETLAPLVIRDIDRLIGIEDDKARKSAFRMIGLCAAEACADKLAQALKMERTRFVRPTIILALGNTRSPGRYLGDYFVEPGDPKHVEEERDALRKALGKTVVPLKPFVMILPEYCMLTYMKCEALAAELEAVGCRYKQMGNMFKVRTVDTDKLRCYANRLFDLSRIGDYKTAAMVLDAIGCHGHSYRVEAGAIRPEKRRAFIKDVTSGMEKHGYTDNPSNYTFEIRPVGARLYAVFTDTRFSYRKESIAASINPVAAASIMRLCSPYMRDNASVLDPFCGSATMLIERAYLKPTSSLVGVDISGWAIKAACANRKESGFRIALVHTDILKFTTEPFDEVISNMPFGIRVSNHSENERIYTEFAAKLPSLLKAGGYAFLLTQEKKLFRGAILAQRNLSVVHEENIESGGLCPTLFIIKKERSQ